MIAKQQSLIPDLDPVKRCRTCGERKPYDAFGWKREKRTGRRYRQATCSLCHYKELKEWHKNKMASSPEYRETQKQRARARYVKRTFNLPAGRHESILAAQGGVCAICGRTETIKKSKSAETQPLSVDHDHATGMVRGLLCHACNVGIGQFGDNTDLMRKAISYLENHTASIILMEKGIAAEKKT